MELISLTKVTTPVIGWLAEALGWIMNGIYLFFQNFGVENIGLCIIVFTLIVNLIMTPLRIQQQKNSKIQALISPEMQAITNKYKGKADQRSASMQQAEMQALYDKYGFSPTGGCLPLLIEMPVILALYQVIYRIPAYVSTVRQGFMTVVNAVLGSHSADFVTKITDLAAANSVDVTKIDLTGASEASINNIIDLFAKFDQTEWNTFFETFSGMKEQVGDTVSRILSSNTFLGINLIERPAILSFAVLIPILAGVFQYLAAKTMTIRNAAAAEDDTSKTMNTMNTMMPLMSVVFCLFLPCGVGIYWVASSAVRFVQQWIINKNLGKTSVEELVKANVEKKNKKRAKQGLPPIRDNAEVNVRRLQRVEEKALAEEEAKKARIRSMKEKARLSKEATDAESPEQKTEKAAPNGIAARAGMVRDYNDKHKR